MARKKKKSKKKTKPKKGRIVKRGILSKLFK